MEYVRLNITGRVQGVFFRVSCKRKAIELGITGFVKNMEDDTVQVLAKGTPNNLKEFIFWCKIGNEMSNVEKVTIEKVELDRNYMDFDIIS